MDGSWYVVRLSKADLKSFGSNSLIGLLATASVGFPRHVRIEFEQSLPKPQMWHQDADSITRAIPEADSIVIPDYVPRCLCQDIAYLASQGIALEFGAYHIGEVS